MGASVRAAIPILLLLIASSLSAQVVFSRRIYKEQGTSYQQIWKWNPVNGELKQLTHSPRNHYLPVCKGGKITFVSPGKGQDNSKLWSFDSATGEERAMGPAPAPPPRPEAAPKNGCDWTAKAANLEACATDQNVSLSRAGKPFGRVRIQINECTDARGGAHGPCATPILSLAWSPGGKWLLVGALGLNTNSTAPQFDYYVIDPASMKLQKAASAEQYSMIWLPGREELLYITPRDLAPLAGSRRARGVWVQQLMLFNPATATTKAITTGVANNQDASLCRQ